MQALVKELQQPRHGDIAKVLLVYMHGGEWRVKVACHLDIVEADDRYVFWYADAP